LDGGGGGEGGGAGEGGVVAFAGADFPFRNGGGLIHGATIGGNDGEGESAEGDASPLVARVEDADVGGFAGGQGDAGEGVDLGFGSLLAVEEEEVGPVSGIDGVGEGDVFPGGVVGVEVPEHFFLKGGAVGPGLSGGTVGGADDDGAAHAPMIVDDGIDMAVIVVGSGVGGDEFVGMPVAGDDGEGGLGHAIVDLVDIHPVEVDGVEHGAEVVELEGDGLAFDGFEMLGREVAIVLETHAVHAVAEVPHEVLLVVDLGIAV